MPNGRRPLAASPDVRPARQLRTGNTLFAGERHRPGEAFVREPTADQAFGAMPLRTGFFETGDVRVFAAPSSAVDLQGALPLFTSSVSKAELEVARPDVVQQIRNGAKRAVEEGRVYPLTINGEVKSAFAHYGKIIVFEQVSDPADLGQVLTGLERDFQQLASTDQHAGARALEVFEAQMSRAREYALRNPRAALDAWDHSPN